MVTPLNAKRAACTRIPCMVCILLAVMPLIADAQRDQKEPLDLAMLERQDELTREMTPAQRLKLVRIEEAIRQAQSDLRSGQFMVDTKPSIMQPDRDIKSINAEGEKIKAQAEDAIYKNQKELIEFLQKVDADQKAAQTTDETKFDLELDTVPYGKALESACRSVMETARQRGYEALFFHEVFIRNSDGIRPAGSALRNEAYDTLIAIDGTNFSLHLPVDFQLKAETAGQESDIFEYANADSFKRDKKALIVIEINIPEDSSTGLLAVGAVNIATQRLDAMELFKITDLAALLDEEDRAESADQALQRIELRGGADTIKQLANLAEPYLFELQSSAEDSQVRMLLTHTLFHNSDLLLAEGNFIKEAYGSHLDEPGNWQGQANAGIRISQADSGDAYELTLQAKGSDRALPAGTATVFADSSE